MISGTFYALLAGFLGAAASLSAKLSLGADYLRDMCESGFSGWTPTHSPSATCDWAVFSGQDFNIVVLKGMISLLRMKFKPTIQLHLPLRLLCGGLLFTCNAVMWTFFSKALRHCSSSARATVTTTASNFISSAILGRVIFGEAHAALWWMGISLTLCGLLVLHGSLPQTFPQEDGTKDK